MGFLYADGNVSTNSYHISCDLHIDDIEHLEKLYSALNIFRLPRTDNKLQRCRFAISCKHIKDALIEKGCVPNKSYVLKFPDENIFKSKDLIRHFIRGYFDGDGSLGLYDKPEISCLGAKEFLSKMVSYLEPRHLFSNNHSDFTFAFSFSGIKATAYLYHLYYKSTIYLDRKYQIFNKIKDCRFKEKSLKLLERKFREG